ncbi:MAG: 50S ribosomal protein L10 [Candidatus Dormibacteria bacterium]
MPNPTKAERVELLVDRLRRSRAAVITDYRGLTVHQLEELRGKLREQNLEFRVVKNTLARRAATEAGYPEFNSELVGPVGLAFGFDDPAAVARVLQDWIRATRVKMAVKGGLVEGRILSEDQVKELAELPSREVLLGRLLGTIQAPLAQLAALLDAPMQNLLGVMKALEAQKA